MEFPDWVQVKEKTLQMAKSVPRNHLNGAHRDTGRASTIPESSKFVDSSMEKSIRYNSFD